MFGEGNVVIFSYPEDNRVGVKTRLNPRRIVVRKERDLRESPLESRTIKLDPNRRRGQLLITGFDIDRQRVRRFYFDSMRSLKVSDQPLMRLGLYDPLVENDVPQLFGSLWTDSRADQAEVRRMIRLVNDWLADRQSTYCIGLFPLQSKSRVSA
jgi:hypothetical protein